LNKTDLSERKGQTYMKIEEAMNSKMQNTRKQLLNYDLDHDIYNLIKEQYSDTLLKVRQI
jgi:hypothetical protein